MYNGIGNIDSVTTTTSTGTTSTQSFTYGDTANPDRLTQFGTKAITYDSMGTLNMFAGIGSGMATAIAEMGKVVGIGANSTFAYHLLAGTIAGGTEVFYDTASFFYSF